LAASIINNNSIRLSDGGGVDCTIKTWQPLTVSSKEGSNSPSLKYTIDVFPSGCPNFSAIVRANSLLAEAANILTLDDIVFLWLAKIEKLIYPKTIFYTFIGVCQKRLYLWCR
jgi:hypothetical protein